jgi:hypothetical protein
MIPEGKLGVSLPAFLETFRCPCCHGANFVREHADNSTMMFATCSCGMVIMFLYNYESDRVAWLGTKEVVVHGRIWKMSYSSWQDRTCFSAAEQERFFEGFVAPERFAKLVVYL